jgi:hypothetical protein
MTTYNIRFTRLGSYEIQRGQIIANSEQEVRDIFSDCEVLGVTSEPERQAEEIAADNEWLGLAQVGGEVVEVSTLIWRAVEPDDENIPF